MFLPPLYSSRFKCEPAPPLGLAFFCKSFLYLLFPCAPFFLLSIFLLLFFVFKALEELSRGGGGELKKVFSKASFVLVFSFFVCVKGKKLISSPLFFSLHQKKLLDGSRRNGYAGGSVLAEAHVYPIALAIFLPYREERLAESH